MQVLPEVGFVAEQKAVYSANSPKLFDRLREALRSRHYSIRTEQTRKGQSIFPALYRLYNHC